MEGMLGMGKRKVANPIGPGFQEKNKTILAKVLNRNTVTTVVGFKQPNGTFFFFCFVSREKNLYFCDTFKAKKKTSLRVVRYSDSQLGNSNCMRKKKRKPYRTTVKHFNADLTYNLRQTAYGSLWGMGILAWTNVNFDNAHVAHVLACTKNL